MTTIPMDPGPVDAFMQAHPERGALRIQVTAGPFPVAGAQVEVFRLFGQLRQVFLWRASFITLRGLAWGNAVGLGLCFVQRYFHVVRLSSEGYLLSEVPISLGWGWWLALNAGAVAAIVALLVVPTYIVSTVKPDESIRYE